MISASCLVFRDHAQLGFDAVPIDGIKRRTAVDEGEKSIDAWVRTGARDHLEKEEPDARKRQLHMAGNRCDVSRQT